VTTQKRGRETLRFLNPVPIRLIHDRWVSKYAEPWAATLTGLRRHWRRKTMESCLKQISAGRGRTSRATSYRCNRRGR
jgi:hypothetical protein